MDHIAQARAAGCPESAFSHPNFSLFGSGLLGEIIKLAQQYGPVVWKAFEQVLPLLTSGATPAEIALAVLKIVLSLQGTGS